MSVCPGCGRCRECGQRAAPAPIYPWYGTGPYVAPSGPIWINPWPNTGTPIPTGPYQITCNTGGVL